MNNTIGYTDSEEFYPTPPSLIDKMLDGIDWNYISTILEPSAGKGNILKEIAKRAKGKNVDAIEYDDNLRQILQWNFSKDRLNEIEVEEKKFLEKCGYKYYEERRTGWYYFDNIESKYLPIPESNFTEFKKYENQKKEFFSEGIHIVAKDFLTYEPFKQYDLIIMNPPFSNGDRHLLKAIKMQEDFGGNIVCLLNAETIKNPFTQSRKYLAELLEKYNAQIEFIENGFNTAERKTDVEVALVKIVIPPRKEESTIYEHFKNEEHYEEFNTDEKTEIEVTDFLKSIINRYKIEIKSGLELIKLYNDLSPYLRPSFDNETNLYGYNLIRLMDKSGHNPITVNTYVKSVRNKYWTALLTNKKVTGQLTSTLQEKYRKKVATYEEYDFSEFNIKMLLNDMNAHIKKGIEEEIDKMYDRLTEEHTYYPECSKNKHLYDGWKTNKAWKIDKKVIIPVYGIFDEFYNKPREYKAYDVLSDIERILNFFDGNLTADVNLKETIESYFNQGTMKNIPCKYFKATFYKKGTCHLVFTCPELIKRFNIYAAKHRGWLPPSYGKKTYEQMDEEEKKVIDDFQGKEDYNIVLSKPEYYLNAPIKQNVLMIEG